MIEISFPDIFISAHIPVHGIVRLTPIYLIYSYNNEIKEDFTGCLVCINWKYRDIENQTITVDTPKLAKINIINDNERPLLKLYIIIV